MQMDATATHTLVLGIGNVLLSDDGIGVHVINTLNERAKNDKTGPPAVFRDGGTIGLALLTEIEQSGALIAVDAMDLGAAAGTIRMYRGAEMNARLGGNKKTAHEVALADLIAAASLSGCAPERRALVAVQPESTEWGLSPSEAVQAAIPDACAAVIDLIEEWADAR
jgi:hydrogenase maturation protease